MHQDGHAIRIESEWPTRSAFRFCWFSLNDGTWSTVLVHGTSIWYDIRRQHPGICIYGKLVQFWVMTLRLGTPNYLDYEVRSTLTTGVSDWYDTWLYDMTTTNRDGTLIKNSRSILRDGTLISVLYCIVRKASSVMHYASSHLFQVVRVLNATTKRLLGGYFRKFECFVHHAWSSGSLPGNS